MAKLETAASKAKSDSAMTRRGPQNPNRMRQPTRAGKQLRDDLVSPIKGPDKGMG